MSAIGPTRTICDVRLRAAVRGTADIKRALIRSALIISTCPRRAISAAANQEPRGGFLLGSAEAPPEAISEIINMESLAASL